MDTHKDNENEDVVLSTQEPLPRSGVLKDGVGGYIEIERVRKLEEVKHEMGTAWVPPAPSPPLVTACGTSLPLVFHAFK